MSALKMRRALGGLWDNTGMLIVFVVLYVFVSFFVPDFFSGRNMVGLLLAVSTVGVIACTMLFCLASGDFDLSVGSVVAMSGVVAAVVVNKTNSVGIGMVAGVLAGGAVGLLNGVVIARVGINALITTLATMQIVRGLAFISSDGKAVGVTKDGFESLGMSIYFGVPAPIWILIGCFIVFGVLLNRTTFGRNTLAIGGNKEAARLAGIAVTRTKILIFTMQGLAAGFAGVILASRFTSGQPTTGQGGQGIELQVIAACVLGGVSLTGGVGTMLGVVVGVLIMGTVQNAMDLLNTPPFYQYVVSGGILLAAVMVDRLKQRGRD